MAKNNRFSKADFIARPSNGIGSALQALGAHVPLRYEPRLVITGKMQPCFIPPHPRHEGKRKWDTENA